MGSEQPGWGSERGKTIKVDLNVRGRERCRDAQGEALTIALTPPSAARQPGRPPKSRDLLKRCHLNNCLGRGRQPDRETGAPRRLLSPSTQFTAGAPAGIPARPYALRAASITPRRSRDLHSSWEGEEGAMGEGRQSWWGGRTTSGMPKTGAGLVGLNQSTFALVHVGHPWCTPRASSCTRASLASEGTPVSLLLTPARHQFNKPTKTSSTPRRGAPALGVDLDSRHSSWH